MNTAEVVINDVKTNQYIVCVNGANMQVAKVADYSKGNGFTPHYFYSIRVAHDYNPSGAFTITARSISVLINKLRKHQDKLVKPTV